MIRVFNITVVTAGTAVALSATVRRPAQWVSIQAADDNDGNIFHGSEDVNAAGGIGHAISPGGGGGAPQYPTMGMGVNAYDLREIYIDALNDGDVARILVLESR